MIASCSPGNGYFFLLARSLFPGASPLDVTVFFAAGFLAAGSFFLPVSFLTVVFFVVPAFFTTAFLRGLLTFTASTTSSSFTPKSSSHFACIEFDPRAVQGVADRLPTLIVHETPIHEDMVLVGVQFQEHALLPEVFAGADIFEVGNIILEDDVSFKGKSQSFGERFLTQVAGAFIEIGGRGFDPAAGIGEAVVVNDQPALVLVNVGVGKDVFVHRCRSA